GNQELSRDNAPNSRPIPAAHRLPDELAPSLRNARLSFGGSRRTHVDGSLCTRHSALPSLWLHVSVGVVFLPLDASRPRRRASGCLHAFAGSDRSQRNLGFVGESAGA